MSRFETLSPTTANQPQQYDLTRLVQASMLNQQGAALLLRHRVYEAVKCFQQALATMNLVVPPFPNHPIPVTLLQEKLRMQEEGHGFVYTKPFFLNRQAQPCEGEMNSYLAIITFNLALAYHQVGQSVWDGGRYLLSARSLYEGTLSLLNCQRHYDCSNVIIASLNNMACLYVELYRPYDAYQMLFWLETLIKEERVRTDTLHGDDIADVVLNIRILLMPVCAGAA